MVQLNEVLATKILEISNGKLPITAKQLMEISPERLSKSEKILFSGIPNVPNTIDFSNLYKFTISKSWRIYLLQRIDEKGHTDDIVWVFHPKTE